MSCDCSDTGSGYLLDQTYDEADVPEGWTPVQACDICKRFDDEAAARHAARRHGADLDWFPPADKDGHGDWAIRILGPGFGYPLPKEHTHG